MGKRLMDDKNTSRLLHASRVLHVTLHPARKEIIELLLGHEEMNMTQIFDKCKILRSADASFHLMALKDSGIVRSVSRGKFSFYSVNRERLAKIIEISELLYHK